MLSFAVRGNVRVLEGEGTKHYLLELLHTRDLDPAEQAVLRLLFPGQHAGTSRDLKTKDTKLGAGLAKQFQAVTEQVLADGLRERKGGRLPRWLLVGAVLTGILTLVGVKQYIDIAQAERLRVLQSPEGALRSPTGRTRHPFSACPIRGSRGRC